MGRPTGFCSYRVRREQPACACHRGRPASWGHRAWGPQVVGHLRHCCHRGEWACPPIPGCCRCAPDRPVCLLGLRTPLALRCPWSGWGTGSVPGRVGAPGRVGLAGAARGDHHQVVGRLSWAGTSSGRGVGPAEGGGFRWSTWHGVQLQHGLGPQGVVGCLALVWKRFEGTTPSIRRLGDAGLGVGLAVQVVMVLVWPPPEWCRVLVVVLRVWRVASGGCRRRQPAVAACP